MGRVALAEFSDPGFLGFCDSGTGLKAHGNIRQALASPRYAERKPQFPLNTGQRALIRVAVGVLLLAGVAVSTMHSPESAQGHPEPSLTSSVA